ncbi:hemicentin-2-like [Leptidea sinapis]|uniref:hemicentin-2-like n=1 Tax=Leptidea sinapis TaxID=189913 RepID=UPI00214683D0|nr:hemicentin-2-like [Leptidea sinapis]XP_050667290.1 hemicentin-2-like [Leptidea sinapis]XP_050667291.1 hemicentin-2-like [Leptidea sinapis]XP_050667292.1 hemicentin-2-like [Leptidea sinapis]
MWAAKISCIFILFDVTVAGGGWEPLGQPYFDNSTRREATAAVGQPAYLHCRVRNLADRAVSWIRKRDLHILTVGVHTYSSDARFAALHADGSDEWTLRVAPAQPRDSGVYECQVSTEPKISLSFRLTVVVSKAEILSGPELFVRAGSDINLTCVAKHAPDPPSFIYWYRGEQVVNYAQRGGISVETEQRTRTSRLLIARASPHDSGNYTCAPSSSESASVIVHVLSGERPAAMQSSSTLSSQIKPAFLIIFTSISTTKLDNIDHYITAFITSLSNLTSIICILFKNLPALKLCSFSSR